MISYLQLPWTAATKAKDKPAVIELKREYFEDPSKMIAWIASSVNAANEKVLLAIWKLLADDS